MFSYLPTSVFKWIASKNFDSNKHNNSSKGCILKVYLENPKELHELHNDYPLVPDKIEIKTDIFFKCQLMIGNFL